MLVHLYKLWNEINVFRRVNGFLGDLCISSHSVYVNVTHICEILHIVDAK